MLQLQGCICLCCPVSPQAADVCQPLSVQVGGSCCTSTTTSNHAQRGQAISKGVQLVGGLQPLKQQQQLHQGVGHMLRQELCNGVKKTAAGVSEWACGDGKELRRMEAVVLQPRARTCILRFCSCQ